METKYPTTDESLKMISQLEQSGFDLERWEELEIQNRLVQVGERKRMGDEGFELMEFRMMIQEANDLL